MPNLFYVPALYLLVIAVLVIAPAQAQAQHKDHAHAHGKVLMMPAGRAAPSLKILLTRDAVRGWNLHVQTRNFKFAPEHASGKHVEGEGHAHIYVNGKKIARLYGPWFHIGELSAAGAEVRVTLNANDHRDLMVGGKAVAATVLVGAKMKSHAHK